MSGKEVTIYTTKFCPYCIRAKSLLQSKSIAFNEIKVDFNAEKRREMEALSGRHTVPQIWIGDQHIGGCDELYTLEHRNELDQILIID